MENVCHTLLGGALGKAGLNRKSPLATPVLVIAANLPDIDIFGRVAGKNYLDFHRGITHAAAGVVGLSLVMAAAAWGASAAVLRSRDRRPRFFPLWYVSLAGLLTHPLLDYLNDYGIRPLAPFSMKWYYGDLLAVVDPWLWVLLGAALFLATRSLSGKALWVALGLLLGAIVFWGAGLWFGLLWCAALGAVLLAGRAMRLRGWNVPRAALTAVAAYLLGTAALHWIVLRGARSVAAETVPEPVIAVSVLPGRAGSGHRWTAVYETPSAYYFADTGWFGFSRERPALERFARNLDDPCYRRALAQEQKEISIMARFARFPSVSSERAEGGCTVVLRDLRYARKALSGWGVATAKVE